MNPTEFINHLKQQSFYDDQVAHIERLSPRRASYASLERPLLRPLVEAIQAGGTARLYTHQAEAINAVRAGQDVVVATGTASGKTLCYNLPTLEAILLNPQARAVYLFPTKALAQDQLRVLKNLVGQLKTIAAKQPDRPLSLPHFGAYDGD